MRKRINLTVICALSFILFSLLSGCDNSLNLSSYSSYAEAEKYTASDKGQVTSVSGIDIDWLVGNVSIETNDSDHIEFFEIAYEDGKQLTPEKTDEAKRLHYYFDGTTLRIKFAASREKNLKGLSKDLTVTVPNSLSLGTVGIENVSGDVKVGALTVRHLKIDTVSGNINCVASAQNLSADSVSGAIKLDVNNACKEVEADSVSGNIEIIANANISELSADTTSGNVNITVNAAVNELSVENLSGSIITDINVSVREADFESISGDITLNISNIGFRLETKKSFTVPDGITKTGNFYTYLDGAMEIEVETVSGAFNLNIK